MAAEVGIASKTHFYQHHRPHGSLGWHTPQATLTHSLGDNLSGQHTSQPQIPGRT
jgi:hypothetical protein